MSLLQDIISKSNIKLHELTVLPLLNCTPWFTTAERIAIGHQPKMNRPPRYFVLSIRRRPLPSDTGCFRRRSLPAAAAPICGRCSHARRRSPLKAAARSHPLLRRSLLPSLLFFSTEPTRNQWQQPHVLSPSKSKQTFV